MAPANSFSQLCKDLLADLGAGSTHPLLMKKKLFRRVTLLVALLIAPFRPAYSQGPLIPPGAPAPTMKSLDQVEARTIINAANTPGDLANQFIISQPGSYFLTGNITGVSGKSAISVTASNVTIDLNGFSLNGVAGSLYGIRVPAPVNKLTVRNGVVSNWGSEGLSAYFANASRFKEVTAYGNSIWGLVIGVGSAIDSCQVLSNGPGSSGGGGMYARFSSTITNCVAESNTTHGIYTEDGCMISGCTAGDTAQSGGANGHGITTGLGCTVTGCAARSNAGTGITVFNECLVSSCAVSNNALGINTGNNSSVSNCTVTSSHRAGISTGTGSMITSCAASGNATTSSSTFDAGITPGAGCVVASCVISSNQTTGIFATDSCLISRCSSSGNFGSGIVVENACTVQDCLAMENHVAGILVLGFADRIDGNNVAGNLGIDDIFSSGTIGSGATVVVRNSVGRRMTATAGTDFGPQARAATATSPWANLAPP